MTDHQRMEVARMAASTVSPHRQVVQARELLLAVAGVAPLAATIRRERRRGRRGEREGAWAEPSLPPGTVEEVLPLTHEHLPPDCSTHWSKRTMAAHVGIGKDAVAKTWADRQLKPWKADTFKVSNDRSLRLKEKPMAG